METAILLPLVLLISAGGAVLGLAGWEKTTLTWGAQEASYAAATAGAEDSACIAARKAAAAAAGRPPDTWSRCDGSDGLQMQYNDPPGMVTITIEGSTWTPPFLDPVTIEASAASVFRDDP